MPGVREVLDRLAVPFCVATSSSPAPGASCRCRWSGCGRWSKAALFTASEVARGKPAPDLFLHAAARWGPTRPAVW